MSNTSERQQPAQLRNYLEMISRPSCQPQCSFPHQHLLAADCLFPLGIVQFLLPSTQQLTAFSPWEFHSFCFQWPSSQQEVPSRNCTILTARLLANSSQKPCNFCLLVLLAAQPVRQENCVNFAFQPLLPAHSRNCIDSAYLCEACKFPLWTEATPLALG